MGWAILIGFIIILAVGMFNYWTDGIEMKRNMRRERKISRQLDEEERRERESAGRRSPSPYDQ